MHPHYPHYIGVGYEGRTIGAFLHQLRDDAVTAVADVRLTPISRKPGFSKTALRNCLSERGIGYVHLPALGNPKDNDAGFAADSKSLAHFKAEAHYTNTVLSSIPAWSALQTIIRIGQQGRVALLCYEEDSTRCHRDIILDELHYLTTD